MRDTTFKTLISRLRSLREEFSVTQKVLSTICGLSYKHYQAIEGGKKKEIRISTLDRIASAYGIQLHELLDPLARTKRPASPKAAATKAKRARKRSLK